MADSFPKKIEIHHGNGEVMTGKFSQTFQDSIQDSITLSALIGELKSKNRFILSNEHATFVDKYIEYARCSKVHKFNEGEEFFRARINDYGNNDKHFSLDEMGAPPPYKASQNRVNPAGIPYLYLANNIKTAVSEVRPWIGCKITVAKFTLKKEASVVNFSNKVFVNVTSDKQYEVLENVWRELITRIFSMPFDPRDDIAYIPTQYISERFKKEGLDGIIYDSALNEDGYNLCLFDVGIAEANKGNKVMVNSMDIKMSVEDIE